MPNPIKIFAIIPAYNSGPSVCQVVAELYREVEWIYLVDDGSDEVNKTYYNKCLDFGKVELITLSHNSGKGYALFSGIEAALKNNPDYILTIDSDGQHQPKEIQKFKHFLNMENRDYDLIVGSREEVRKMPFRSKLGNVFTANLFKSFTQSSLKDTQSGYRMLSKEFASDVIRNIKPGRYETEMKMLLYAHETNRNIYSVRIETVYIDDNKNSAFRPLFDSFRVLSSFSKYIAVALASFAVDYLIFLLFLYLLSTPYIYSHIISRICSGVFNYYANKTAVFKSKRVSHLEKIRYIGAVLFNLSMTSPMLYVLVGILNISPAFAKPFVQVTMSVVNFFLLRNIVFINNDPGGKH
jgi:glycosyltransferase involved in cell wall biosynthesis